MLGFAPLASAALASSGDTNTRVLYLAATEAKDAATLSVETSGTIYVSATEAVDVIDFIVGGAIVIYAEATEAADVVAFTVDNIDIRLVAVEQQDSAVCSITMSGTLSMAASEAPDAYIQKAYLLWVEPDEPDDTSIWVPKNDPATYLTTVI